MGDILLEVIGYSTARLLLPVITFGRVRVQPLKSPASGFNWIGFRRDRDGRLICSAPIAGALGLFIWMLLIPISLALF
jgi:hypothetical protein